MQVVNPGQQTTDPAQWGRNLACGVGLLAAVLAGAALVFWVAANWPRMTPDARLAGVQGALALLTVLMAGLVWLGRPGAQGLAGLTAVATGALLALVGQIYQTGADTWTLFLVWAFLILPWVALVRDAFLVLLWVALLNVALGLWLGVLDPVVRWPWGSSLPFGVWLLVLDGLLLVLAEGLARVWRDPWHLIRRALAAATLAWAVAVATEGAWQSGDGISGGTLLLAAVFILGVYGVYARWRPDPAVAALALLAGIGVIGLVLVPHVGTLTGLLGLAVLLLALGLGAARHALRLRQAHALPAKAVTAVAAPAPEAAGTTRVTSPETDAAPWYVTALRMGILVPVVLLLGAWVAFSFDLQSAGAVLGVGLLLLSVGLVVGRMPVGAFGREGGDVLVILGVLLCAGGAVWLTSEDDAPGLALAILLPAGAVAYGLTRPFAVRLATAGLTLGTTYWLTLPEATRLLREDVPDASGFGLGGRLAVLLVLGSVVWILSQTPGQRARWRPLAWALLSLAAGVSVLLVLWGQWIGDPWMQPGTVGLFLCAALPGLLLVWMAAQGPGLLRGWQWGAAAGVVVAGLGWMYAPLCSVALTCLVLGRWAGDRPMQAQALLLGLTGLVLHYFDDGSGTLLYKATVLGLTALWLAGMAVLLYWPSRSTIPGPRLAHRGGWRLPVGLLAGGVLVLGVVQFQVHRYETILAQGQPVILALAPVDPRSLMQGDYMALDYAVRRQAEEGVRTRGDVRAALKASGRGWLLLRPDAQGVGQLLAVMPEAPEAAGAGTVALAFHWRENRVDWGARSWFFPEGQGERYAQARYGVLRVAADGTALLAGMLDEDLSPL